MEMNKIVMALTPDICNNNLKFLVLLWNAINAFIHHFSLKKNDFSLKKNDFSLKRNHFSLKKNHFSLKKNRLIFL